MRKTERERERERQRESQRERETRRIIDKDRANAERVIVTDIRRKFAPFSVL